MTIIQIDSCIECTTRVFNTFSSDRTASLASSGIHRLVLKHRFWRRCADTTFCWGYLQSQTPNPIPVSALAPRDPPLPTPTSTRLYSNFPPHVMCMDIFQHLKRVVPKCPYSMNFWQNDAKYWDFVWEGCGCSGEVRRVRYSAWRKAESPATHIWTVMELQGRCERHREPRAEGQVGVGKGEEDPRDLVARGLVPENWKDAETESEEVSESEKEKEERKKRGRSRTRRPAAGAVAGNQVGKTAVKNGDGKQKEKPEQEVLVPTDLTENMEAVTLR